MEIIKILENFVEDFVENPPSSKETSKKKLRKFIFEFAKDHGVNCAAHYENQEVWVGAQMGCDLCGHRWTAVYYQASEKLQCPECKNMVSFENLL